MNGTDGDSVTLQNNQWMLFGIDMRHIGQQWLAAWRELLFAENSPIRRRLDEPVVLTAGDESAVYQGGTRLAEPPTDGAGCSALLLPDELVLARTLQLPLAAEADLAAVISMEVAAGSPFPPDDTVYGWAEASRDAQTMAVVIAIASRASVQRWLTETASQPAAAATASAPEIWAEAFGQHVTIRGFGEGQRETAYRKRLLRSGLLLGALLLLVLLSAALFAVQQRSALEAMESERSAVEQEARAVSRLREALAAANETIGAANAVITRYPNPHLEVARLTELLGDDAFVAHFSMRGTELRIRGQAEDAAMVMQTLAETPAFTAVTAPQAITSVGSTGREQFYLDIEVASPGEAEDETP